LVCLSNAEATLELHDTHNEVAGRLTVELHVSGAIKAGKAAAARRDIMELGAGVAKPSPMQDAVDDTPLGRWPQPQVT